MSRIVTTAAALLAATGVQADGVLTEFPRTADGHPDLSGVWQALNTAHWNLEPHVSDYPVLLELGAQFAVPPGPGVVEGGAIPYLPAALAERNARFENRLTDDPEGKCYMGGIPRSTYLPYPFQILQSPDDVYIAYQFATAYRRIFVNGQDEAPLDSWMGWSNGRWDGDTFVVEVTGLNGQTWLDRAGNFYTDAVHVVERLTAVSPYHLWYEATIEDPKVFTRPWKISFPLYRRMERDVQLMEFKCQPFVEELVYGRFTKKPTS